jgi:hypothetical protein
VIRERLRAVHHGLKSIKKVLRAPSDRAITQLASDQPMAIATGRTGELMTGAGISSVTLAIALIAACAAAAAWLLYFHKPRDRPRRRLAFIESSSLGGGRKLVLVRRDGVEHLLLVGGPIDLVVEAGIRSEHVAARENLAAPESAPGALFELREALGRTQRPDKLPPEPQSQERLGTAVHEEMMELTVENEAQVVE